VTVTGRTFADSGALIADSIHRYDALPAIANAEVVVSGSIWRIYSDFDFYVGYQRVLALPDAAVPDGELVRGSRVRVMGTLSADGVVHASEVVVLSSPSEKQVFEIGGIVDAVNVGSLGSRTMTLLGVDIGFNSGTLTVDMPSFNPSSPDAVAVGNFVYAQVFEDGSAGYMARQEGLNGRSARSFRARTSRVSRRRRGSRYPVSPISTCWSPRAHVSFTATSTNSTIATALTSLPKTSGSKPSYRGPRVPTPT
jgi:hypothetical protein